MVKNSQIKKIGLNAAAWFWTYDKKREDYLHELTQIVGALGPIEYLDFIINGEYTQHGLNSGKILYSRLIGSKSPDINPVPIF